MTSPKQRNRARRRVERTMAEAFEAAAGGRLALADKLSRRAVDDGWVNPRIWRDRGRIARLCGDDDAAEQAFRHAIAIAPTYGAAFADLGRLQADRGKLDAAERLLRRAVELRPDDAALGAEHAALAPHRTADDAAVPEPADPPPPAATPWTGRFDWAEIAAALDAHGVARLPRLCDADLCARLAALDRVAVEGELVRDDAGARAAWTWLAPPLPAEVAGLREDLYARLAPLANDHLARFGRPERVPRAWPTLAARCAEAGQVRSGVAVLGLGDGGFVAAEPGGDRPRVAFPFRALVHLGPAGPLTHVLRDLRPGRRVHARATELRPGDGLVAFDRRRVVHVGGAAGLQDVAHGVAAVAGRPRAALLLPFVDT